MATKSPGRRLAPAPTFRDRIAVQAAPITREIADRRRRVAFCELFTEAARKPGFIYELQRRDPRHPLPDARQHALIQQGIREGYISRERIIRYRAAQLMDDLSAFPNDSAANERLLAQLLREIGEGVESAIVAEGTPSLDNRTRAVRELREVGAVCALYVTTIEPETVA